MTVVDFSDSIKALGERISKLLDTVKTEEATKTAMVLPFIQMLGYDVFNPQEVTPELIADVGMKKGEKVDYAIYKDGKPIIIIECKHHSEVLKIENAAQLARYFHVTTSRFGILTNGMTYKFYTDLVEPNKMDEKPFFEFDLTQISDVQIEELKKFHKNIFDLNQILTTASELKYTKAIKDIFQREISNPSEDFIKYFATEVSEKRMTAKTLEIFTPLVKKSIHQAISEMITARLRSALDKETALQSADQTTATTAAEEPSKIITTVEEMEAFFVVKAIVRSAIEASRVGYRDGQTYFSITLDDSPRKTICRLFLNGSKKYIVTFDEAKKEIRNDIASIDDIYSHSAAILTSVALYK